MDKSASNEMSRDLNIFRLVTVPFFHVKEPFFSRCAWCHFLNSFDRGCERAVKVNVLWKAVVVQAERHDANAPQLIEGGCSSRGFFLQSGL